MCSNNAGFSCGIQKAKSAKDAEAILSKGLDTLSSMQKIMDAHFETCLISTIADSYESQLMSQPDALNSALLSAITVYRDTLSSFIFDVTQLERFITLHIPAIEDGNNFGVTVQLEIAKLLKETKAELQVSSGD